MTTMVEKMARATYAKWIEDVQALEPSWENLPESHRGRLMAASSAALQAIREADMHVGLIGAAEVNKQMRGPVKADYCAAQDSFTAMIDAILEGHGSSADADTHREAGQPVVGCFTGEPKWREVSEVQWRQFLRDRDLKFSVTQISEPPMARVVREDGEFVAYADFNWHSNKLERFFIREGAQ